MESQELLKKALAMPEEERAELAGNLLASLDMSIDEDADAAWQKEIARRQGTEAGPWAVSRA